jgi:hypothetical protein
MLPELTTAEVENRNLVLEPLRVLVWWWVACWAHLSIASSTGRTRLIGVRSGGASP